MVKFLDEAGLIRYTEKLKNLLAGKQDKLEGAGGQVVGFDSSGKAVPQGTESLRGPAGKDGTDGTDGKTAYQYAVDGGYTGTEAEFQAMMGTGPWLPLAGGEMAGNLIMNDHFISKVQQIHFVNKNFNASDSKCIFFNIDSSHPRGFYRMRGEIVGAMASAAQIEVGTPVTSSDAANKAYVDNLIAGLEARIAALEAK